MSHSGLVDLVLSYPQWQGSGRWENLRKGAHAAAGVCRRYGPVVHVPDAGAGEAGCGVNRWTAILEQFRSARSLLRKHQPKRVLTAGGDCACDIAVIDYLHGRYPELTVLWIDAHLDANTVETTPSGNFHGMPVAAIMGSPPSDLQSMLTAPLSPSQFRYVTAHVGDDGDWAFQRQKDLKWHEPGQTLSAGAIHIHFDLDALDPAEFPHVAYPDGRLTQQDALALVRSVASCSSLVGLTITEFAPTDERGAVEGIDFLERLCAAAWTAF